jgi:hypothetical protein
MEQVTKFNNIYKLIHGNEKIYENLDISNFQFNLSSGILNSFFIEILKTIKEDDLIIEVGTWEGASAIGMGEILKNNNIQNFTILCIDTWLGNSYHREGGHLETLRIKNGYPQLFFHFLKNVKSVKMENNIIPFPTQSIDAARYLSKHNISPKLIYIDASHLYPDVYLDINFYYDLLQNGGIICGDDYTWDDVKFSIHKFTKEKNLKLQIYLDKWIIFKNE